MLDQDFREKVIASLSKLETLAEESKTAAIALHKEHTDLDTKVDGLKTRVDWASGIGAALYGILAMFGVLHRAK